MIIDCHTHVESMDEEVLEKHREASRTVDGSIILASPCPDNRTSNDQVAQYTETNPNHLFGFAVVNPCKEKTGQHELEVLIHEQHFKGVVLYCSSCGFHPSDTHVLAFLEVVQSLSIPVFFHTSDHMLGPEAALTYAQPILLDDIARQFPDLRMIIGSMGTPYTEQALMVVARHEHVFADLTIHPNRLWQTYNLVIAAHEHGVMEKLLFGSGFPDAQPGACMETLLGFNNLLVDSGLPTVPRSAIRAVIERDALSVLGITSEFKQTVEKGSSERLQAPEVSETSET